jgi:hypothetical protein
VLGYLVNREAYKQMKNRELNRRVARRLGEDIATVRQRGFSLVRNPERILELEPEEQQPQIVDWDKIQIERSQGAY